MYPHLSAITLRENKQRLLKLELANTQIYFSIHLTLPIKENIKFYFTTLALLTSTEYLKQSNKLTDKC